MKKIHDFLWFLQHFLVNYMRGRVSDNTLLSYRDTFKLLLFYAREYKNIKESDFDIINLSPDMINDYLRWIEIERGCKPSTVKVRYHHIVLFASLCLTKLLI